MEIEKLQKRMNLLEKRLDAFVTYNDITALEQALAAMIQKYLREPTKPKFGNWGDDNTAKVLATNKKAKECDELSGNDESDETSL